MSNWSGLEDWQKADIACELLKDLVKDAEEHLATFGEYPEHLPSKGVKCLKKAREILQVNFGFGCGMD